MNIMTKTTITLGLLFSMFFSLQLNADGGDSSSSTRKLPANITTLVESENYEQAIVELNEFISDESRNADAWNYLGYSQRKIGLFDDSLNSYEKALKIDKKHLGAHEYVGELYLTLGDLDKANYHLKRLAKYCGDCEEYKELEEAINQHQ